MDGFGWEDVMSRLEFAIVSLNVGMPIVIDYQGRELLTGFFKHPVREPLYLGKMGFEGDGQGDLVHHGGADKAVCVYPIDYYPYWEERTGRKLDAVSFGENITVSGLVEDVIHIGDILQLGEAVVQVTQPRQPCFKLAHKHGIVELPQEVRNTGYTGYYFRVLEEGKVAPESVLVIQERHPLGVSVAYANQIRHHEKDNIPGIKRLLAVDALSSSWRETLSERLMKYKGYDEAE